MEKKFTFKCDCTAQTKAHCDHESVIWFDIGNEDWRYNDVLIHTSLNHYLPFYKRVWVGIKYILGIDNTYCTHTDTYMTEKDFRVKFEEIADFLGYSFNSNASVVLSSHDVNSILDYMSDNNVIEVELESNSGSGIGQTLEISERNKPETKQDITNYNKW